MILHFDTDPAWIEIVSNWAAAKAEIRRVAIFGSRVTGVRTPKTPPQPVPDFNLAIELTDGHEHCWADSSEWAAELGAPIPVEMDCQWLSETETPIVASYLSKGSLVIFDRSS